MTAAEIVAEYSSDDYGVVLSASQWKTIRSALTAGEQRATFLWEALQIVFNDDSGDLDFIKFKIRQFLPGEKL